MLVCLRKKDYKKCIYQRFLSDFSHRYIQVFDLFETEKSVLFFSAYLVSYISRSFEFVCKMVDLVRPLADSLC